MKRRAIESNGAIEQIADFTRYETFEVTTLTVETAGHRQLRFGTRTLECATRLARRIA